MKLSILALPPNKLVPPTERLVSTLRLPVTFALPDTLIPALLNVVTLGFSPIFTVTIPTPVPISTLPGKSRFPVVLKVKILLFALIMTLPLYTGILAQLLPLARYAPPAPPEAADIVTLPVPSPLLDVMLILFPAMIAETPN